MERVLRASARGYVIRPEVLGALARLVSKYHAPAGRSFRVFTGVYRSLASASKKE